MIICFRIIINYYIFFDKKEKKNREKSYDYNMLIRYVFLEKIRFFFFLNFVGEIFWFKNKDGLIFKCIFDVLIKKIVCIVIV